ncbi:uncharacterized protein G2W53_036576 [Senna tora]|uniref:Uncharacterized protein n=1 Tax=Senna tora TaxID=362788 RepID=A0A834SUN2_9FABA|nr:uncharacterized protein G2W53_036576 [Senna tora]
MAPTNPFPLALYRFSDPFVGSGKYDLMGQAQI